MSTKRRLSLKESKRQLRGVKGPNGRGLCRWCGTEVPAGRRTFCCDDHVHEWKLRSDGKYLREHVYRRDLGHCAACGVDTRVQKILLEDALHSVSYREKDPAYQKYLKTLNLTASEARKSLWQADHIRPVEDGGGLCGLSGIQTLCISCHKKKTAAQASYRSKPTGFRPVKQIQRLGLDEFRGVDKIKGV